MTVPLLFLAGLSIVIGIYPDLFFKFLYHYATARCRWEATDVTGHGDPLLLRLDDLHRPVRRGAPRPAHGEVARSETTSPSLFSLVSALFAL